MVSVRACVEQVTAASVGENACIAEEAAAVAASQDASDGETRGAEAAVVVAEEAFGAEAAVAGDAVEVLEEEAVQGSQVTGELLGMLDDDDPCDQASFVVLITAVRDRAGFGSSWFRFNWG